ncbi:MAG: hypothetical protein N2Z20_04230 [Elusimicrobiales bacterium]|nr:hypothetical protein [Elusimicrobiales bacterium]
MSIDKKLDILEKDIYKIIRKVEELYRENIELKEQIRILREREKHLLHELDSYKKNKLTENIKKRLEKISQMIERELNQ